MCPRNREMDRLHRAGHDLMERKSSGWSKHSSDFCVQPCFISNVHRTVLRPHHVEACTGEGHIQGIALLEGDTITQPGSCGQQFSNPTTSSYAQRTATGATPVADLSSASGNAFTAPWQQLFRPCVSLVVH